MPCEAHAIAKLNDEFRTALKGGRLCVTAGLVGRPDLNSIIERVRTFDNFNEDNDPHGEHDFGAIDEGGVRCFWKIEYYDREMEMLSPDPADPSVTTRVLTIMLADEY